MEKGCRPLVAFIVFKSFVRKLNSLALCLFKMMLLFSLWWLCVLFGAVFVVPAVAVVALNMPRFFLFGSSLLLLLLMFFVLLFLFFFFS